MTIARLGGVLFLLGLGALPLTAGPATLQGGPTPIVLSAAALVAFGGGAALITFARPVRLDGVHVRAGLSMLVIAAIGVAISAIAGIGYSGDPLGSWAIIGPLIVAMIAGIGGLVSIAIGLARLKGVPRAIGVVQLLGLALVVPLGISMGQLGQIVSGGMIVIGLLGVGVLAMGVRTSR